MLLVHGRTLHGYQVPRAVSSLLPHKVKSQLHCCSLDHLAPPTWLQTSIHEFETSQMQKRLQEVEWRTGQVRSKGIGE
jgi:hypothetical protein